MGETASCCTVIGTPGIGRYDRCSDAKFEESSSRDEQQTEEFDLDNIPMIDDFGFDGVQKTTIEQLPGSLIMNSGENLDLSF